MALGTGLDLNWHPSPFEFLFMHGYVTPGALYVAYRIVMLPYCLVTDIRLVRTHGTFDLALFLHIKPDPLAASATIDLDPAYLDLLHFGLTLWTIHMDSFRQLIVISIFGAIQVTKRYA